MMAHPGAALPPPFLMGAVLLGVHTEPEGVIVTVSIAVVVNKSDDTLLSQPVVRTAEGVCPVIVNTRSALVT